jgi:hypothetical protein
MAKFGEWLEGQSNSDLSIKSLQDFAKSQADKWPAASDNIEDYQESIRTNAEPAVKDNLLTSLGRVYERWFESQYGKGRFTAVSFGLIGLFVAGLVIAIGLAYGIFINQEFFNSLATTEHARGLITFLFSFATIGIIILVAIAIFWMDKAEVAERFGFAKDLITILVGILGTVLGFYFGSTTK